VLGAISSAKFELQPVIDTIVEIATRLCQAERGAFLRFEDGGFRLVPRSRPRRSGAWCSASNSRVFSIGDAVRDWVTALKANPLLPDRGSLTGRVALDRRTVHVDDLRTDSEYTLGPALQHGVRSELGVPLMRDGEVIGVNRWQRPADSPLPAVAARRRVRPGRAAGRCAQSYRTRAARRWVSGR
jgi:two-component system NtrC family sensor kinase